MKNIFLIIFFCFFSAFSFSVDNETVRGKEIRHEAIIKERLNKEKIGFTEQSLFQNYGAFGTSIFVGTDGDSAEDKAKVIFAVPVSQQDGEESDFLFALDIAVNYIKQFSNEGAGVAFLADEWMDCTGFKALLDSLDDTENTVVLYLNFNQGETNVDIINASKQYITPLVVLEPLIKQFRQASFPFKFGTPYSFLYKINVAYDMPVINIANDRGADIICLNVGYSLNDKSEKDAYLVKLSRIFFNWSREVSLAKQVLIKNNIKNYIPAGYRNYVFIVPEKTIVLFTYLIELIVLFLSFMLFKHSHKKNKLFFLGSHIFFLAAFLICLFIDISLAFLICFSFIFLSFIYFLKINREREIKNKGRVLLRNYIVVFICVVLSLSPFIDISYNIVRLLSFNKNNIAEDNFYKDENTEDSFKVRGRSRLFLSRRIITITINASGEPLSYRLFFDSLQDDFPSLRISEDQLPPFVYSSPVPYTITDRGVEFTLGAYPPNNLELEISLPPELSGVFVTEVSYSNGDHFVEKTAIGN